MGVTRVYIYRVSNIRTTFPARLGISRPPTKVIIVLEVWYTALFRKAPNKKNDICAIKLNSHCLIAKV